MMFGIRANDFMMAGIVVFMIYLVYSVISGARQGRQNMQWVRDRTDETARQAHADAERIAALLEEIRDELKNKTFE